jgi:nicotinamidase-related amidase
MSTTALLVIDFINDIAHTKGKIARSAERIEKNHVIEHANHAIVQARASNCLIIFVKVGFHHGYPECPKSSPLFGPAAQHSALLLDSWGTEFHEKLGFKKSDLIVVKHRVSAFYSTPLETILRANNVHCLALCGTATNMAIEHTARDAHDRDYSVTVLQDACETATEEAHLASIESMSRFCKILKADQFLKKE